MTLDMRGPIQAALERARTIGEQKAEEGDTAGSASAFAQVAGLYRQLSKLEKNPLVRDQRIQLALEYERKASDFRSRATTKPRAASDKDGSDGLAGQIESLIHESSVSWDDISGLEDTKTEIKLAYGLTFAQKPTGVQLEGWRSILLYGPPGTGKTMLAAATSGSLEATFFNVSIGGILSKYFGESSKLITELYSTARERAPSVVFLDEFESLSSQRTGDEAAAERRVLSTLLAELDGLIGKSDDAYVLTIASTNLPWMLDKAILSRFQKQIFVPLPDIPARVAILRGQLETKGFEVEASISEIAERTEGLSGRDLSGLCQEVVNLIVRSLNPEISLLVDEGIDAVRKHTLVLRPITMQDIEVCLKRTRPAVTAADIREYENWTQETQ
jgi:katanin p60 ATPase-containing subunit A1